MRKIFLLLFAAVLIGNSGLLKAQCYGTVVLDNSVAAPATSSFDITTTVADELILISYDGWEGRGTGPITVDGNNATMLGSAVVANSGGAQIWGYIAPTPGTHAIFCDETGNKVEYDYYINYAASFYVTGCNTPLSLSNCTAAENSIDLDDGGSITTAITTTAPNSMIYSTAEFNTVTTTSYPISWNITLLADTHEGDGIEASDAYQGEATAGTYSITATNSAPNLDEGGLTEVVVAITPPECSGTMTVTTTQTEPTCGNDNGSITVNASGGTPPYTYTWTPAVSTTSTASDLGAGTYTIVVNDAGCNSSTVTVTLTGSAITATTTSTSATCGEDNGTATVNASGGTPPYTYLWSPSGQTNATATGLSAGTYTVSITDANGCNIFATATVANSSGITTSITSVTDVACNGGSTGSATVSASGGTPPYTYAWSPSGGTNATATGLSAGTYTVTVTDANGCNTPAIVNITQPSAVRDSISSVTYPTCHGGTGSATVGVKDGVSPYTYSWSPGGETTPTVSTLSAGTYSITVTDNNGCTSTVTVDITQPAAIVVTTTFTATTCGNDNGAAAATATGGTTPYTYAWTPSGGTGATATGLSTGTYTITVTDANGCTGSASVTITAVSSPTVTATVNTNDKCNNSATGSATATVSGGTTPYTYLWTPGGYTTAAISGLSAGTYTITVHDNNGCVTTATVTITQPNPITVTTTSTGVKCNGGSTGTATATATGGTPPYTYLWEPGGQTNATATGLSANTYTVTVTDNNGCTGSATVTVTQPSPLTTTLSSSTEPKCSGEDGSATITAAGGTSPYTYSWNPGGYTTATVSTLSAGTYTITVTDNNGCTETTTVTITQPTAITTTISDTATPCGKDSGTVSVVASGGTGPYTYLWNPGGYTTAHVTGLGAGSYTVTVTDNNGCTATNTVTITTVSSIVLTSGSITDDKCNGGASGSATITATGGTAPYTYFWTPSSQTTATGTGLSAGTYTILVTDSKGCNSTISVTITQPAPLTAPISSTNVTCNGLSNGSATVTPSGGTGPYTYLWSPIAYTTASISGLAAETYTVVVTDANGCTVTNTVTITQPAPLTATLTSTNASCSNNGTATVTAGGGTTPYTYSWSPSAETTATATGLSAGLYTVTVTDNNGCSITDTITVHSNSTLAITISGTDELCNGGATGSATVTATGGTSPYTYLWSPGSGTTSTISALTAGTYTAVVTDNAGCTQFAIITITQPSAITLTTSSTSSGCSNNSGSVSVTATGGTGAYTYLWNPGSGTTSTVSGLGSGTYTITVTDANGCTATATADVGASSVTGSITASTNILCTGNSTGSATVSASGGTAPYTYLWNPSGQTNATATGLSAGSYTVTVTDANGCSFTATIDITQPASALSESNVVANASCNSTDNGSITLTVSGGTPTYTYSWSNGSTTENISGLLPGIYSVTITDANGCTYIDSMTVSYDSSVFANAGNDTILCPNSTIALNGTGSVNATSYAWYQMPGMVLLKDSSVVFVTPTNDTTTYILVVSHGSCTDTSSVTIVLSPAVFANPGPDQTIIGSGTVTLGGSPTGPSGSSYFWSPSSTLNDSIISNPSATPTVTTIYTLTVKNSAGCSATDTVTVFILPGVTIPTGFTPNGDGVNDTWVLDFVEEFPNLQVQVFNRWGEQLFQSTGYPTPWDGTYNGKPVPIGTYYYIIKLNDPRFPKAMTGPLTIMR